MGERSARAEAQYGCRYVETKDGKMAFPVTHEGQINGKKAYGHVQPKSAYANWKLYDEDGKCLLHGCERAETCGSEDEAHYRAERTVCELLGIEFMDRRHGEERNRHEETTHGNPVEFLDPNGDVVFSGSSTSTTSTVVEKWCATCKRWIEVRGVVGALVYMAEHDHEVKA